MDQAIARIRGIELLIALHFLGIVQKGVENSALMRHMRSAVQHVQSAKQKR